MSAINFIYNAKRCYTNVIDNIIILKSKKDNKIIYKLPIPKNFSILGTPTILGEGYQTYIIAPFIPNYPEFIPEDFKDVHIGLSGLYQAYKESEGENIEMTYIDSTLLTPEAYAYATIEKEKMIEDRIPDPFWMPKFNQGPWYGEMSKNQIPDAVSALDPKARLMTEDELLSVFALNELGLEFWESLPDDIYEKSFFRDTKNYVICANDYCLDNWDIVVSSRENQNIYRMMFHEKCREFYENFWYRNYSYIYADDQIARYHVFPVIDKKSLIKR